MALWQAKRGTKAQLPNPLQQGEFGWCTDTKELYLGTGTANDNQRVYGAAISTPFTIYVCTTALGGRLKSAGANGLAMRSSQATSTIANKLVDSGASFDSTYLNKTVYNKTDDTWAKVTTVVSTTQLTLDADIMASGESYDIANALSTVAEGFAEVPNPFYANITVRVSPGTFAESVAFVGKLAAGSFDNILQGSTTGTTTISNGTANVSQKLTVNNITFSGGKINLNPGAILTWSNCPLTNVRVNAYNTADATWDNCDMTGTSKLYTYIGSRSLIKNSTVTVGNDPTNITAVSSTITRGYTLYVALNSGPFYGGNDAMADGLQIAAGTATSTTANKLIDSAASFTSDMVGKTVYNSTDDTWTYITAVDSTTQLSLYQNIMASGEAYVIANAFVTVNAALAAVPGTFNCNTTLKISDGTFTENVVVQGKAPGGPYTLTLEGTLTLLDSLTASSGAQGSSATQGTVVRNSGTWTANQRANKLVTITLGDNNGLSRIIDSNDTTTLTIAGCWIATVGTSTFKVFDWGTVIDGSSTGTGIKLASGQRAVALKKLKMTNSAGAYPDYESVYMDTGSQAEFHDCWFYVGSGPIYGIYQEPYSKSFIYRCFFGDSNARGIFCVTAASDIWQSKFYNATAGNTHVGIRSTQLGKVIVSRGTIIDNFDNTVGGGCYADQNSILVFYTAAADGFSIVRNCGTYGIAATEGSRIKFNQSATYVTYSGNGTNTYADASSTKDY
ncbi:MAG: hypothetical protein HYV24_04585 [Deltaproteobacteria bacterium]|nr:hypothetical protein [Deltaproteobacteria bacterium]